ncbi:MAG: Stp1/IreP family PP2C-type Ser/Thr phosphatase [Deltaproteobacteria bacterium]|nr:Stp1/IreP family PP2C-type Ser/Thr phosphatase [Deltaproteobacteria bacterium]
MADSKPAAPPPAATKAKRGAARRAPSTPAAVAAAAPGPSAIPPPPAHKPSRFKFETHGLTDVGLVRDGNEDALLLMEADQLYVVADGMGGHSAGEVASAFTIEALRSFYGNPDLTQRVRSAYLRARRAKAEMTVAEASPHALRLRKAVESANISVYRLAQQHDQLRDMGTTLVGAVFQGNRIHIANVGDSRLYRMRGGKLRQLTEDHSLLNEYIRMNLLQPEEIENFPYKNVIVRALGLQDQVIVDLFVDTVRRGDHYLLCSDGLTDLVRDEEIELVLRNAPTAQSACYRLTDLAKARGGHDNITTIIVRIHGPDWAPPAPMIPPPPPPGVGGPPNIPPPPPGAAPVVIPPPPPGRAPQ